MAVKKKKRVARKRVAKKKPINVVTPVRIKQKKAAVPLGIKIIVVILTVGAILSITNQLLYDIAVMSVDRSSLIIYSISALQLIGALCLVKLKKIGFILSIAVLAYMLFEEAGLGITYILNAIPIDAVFILIVGQIPIDAMIAIYLLKNRLLFK